LLRHITVEDLPAGGAVYAFLKEYEKAKQDLLKAVELNPVLKEYVKKISDQFKSGLKLD
jgi:hypothetical protein